MEERKQAGWGPQDRDAGGIVLVNPREPLGSFRAAPPWAGGARPWDPPGLVSWGCLDSAWPQPAWLLPVPLPPGVPAPSGWWAMTGAVACGRPDQMDSDPSGSYVHRLIGDNCDCVLDSGMCLTEVQIIVFKLQNNCEFIFIFCI